MSSETTNLQALVAIAAGYTGGIPTSPLVNSAISSSSADSEYTSLQKLVQLFSGVGGGVSLQNTNAGNGYQAFTSATRATTVPLSAYQIGIETDTNLFYYATGTAAGNWQADAYAANTFATAMDQDVSSMTGDFAGLFNGTSGSVYNAQNAGIYGQIYYWNGASLTDSYAGLCYGNGYQLSDDSGNLYYGNDRGTTIADSYGGLHYGNDANLSDANGNLYYGNGANLSDAYGGLYYGNGYQLSNAGGYLCYGNGALLADASGNLYYGNGTTVAFLPAGVQGMICFVTDALAPTYLTPVVGGGTVTCPVFFDGTNWVCH